jgi:hypothetical protein
VQVNQSTLPPVPGVPVSVLLGAMLLVLLIAACGRRATEPVVPVQGRLLYKGRPAAGARIVFHPLVPGAADKPRPQAFADADGAFRLSTYRQGDGALPGQYAVTVAWPSDAKKEEDGTPAGPDRLQGRYLEALTTPLRAAVQTTPTELPPFQLN